MNDQNLIYILDRQILPHQTHLPNEWNETKKETICMHSAKNVVVVMIFRFVCHVISHTLYNQLSLYFR